MKTTQKEMDDVISAEADVQAVLDLTGGEYTSDVTTAATATGTTTASAVAVTTMPTKPSKRFFKANEKPLNDIVRAATGNPSYGMLTRDRHDLLLNGQFQLFCDLVGELLASEFQKTCGLKFLNLMLDIWTSLMASVKNDGHNTTLVANVIAKSFKLKYDVDIKVMTRFTMSDTTPSAKIVTDFIDTEQEDCSIHLLNLCISYGIGLKDIIQTVSVWNVSTVTWDKVVTKITPGGSFDEGGYVIQNLRNLNNYVKAPKQRNALRKIQEALSYPELDPLADNDVRVA
ncbi:hypothetical protein PHPALM_6111 [Phytophthora palmivora]|uniref:Uncharacterized protein n=1 Tax=Phytophthora palmivora TaxID=4796 RepID=A0A2P4YFQ0_9STRA|nr:hypothetical protein PHPALM_6111 [Phytophthora palmivora]